MSNLKALLVSFFKADAKRNDGSLSDIASLMTSAIRIAYCGGDWSAWNSIQRLVTDEVVKFAVEQCVWDLDPRNYVGKGDELMASALLRANDLFALAKSDLWAGDPPLLDCEQSELIQPVVTAADKLRPAHLGLKGRRYLGEFLKTMQPLASAVLPCLVRLSAQSFDSEPWLTFENDQDMSSHDGTRESYVHADGVYIAVNSDTPVMCGHLFIATTVEDGKGGRRLRVDLTIDDFVDAWLPGIAAAYIGPLELRPLAGSGYGRKFDDDPNGRMIDIRLTNGQKLHVRLPSRDATVAEVEARYGE